MQAQEDLDEEFSSLKTREMEEVEELANMLETERKRFAHIKQQVNKADEELESAVNVIRDVHNALHHWTKDQGLTVILRSKNAAHKVSEAAMRAKDQAAQAAASVQVPPNGPNVILEDEPLHGQSAYSFGVLLTMMIPGVAVFVPRGAL